MLCSTTQTQLLIGRESLLKENYRMSTCQWDDELYPKCCLHYWKIYILFFLKKTVLVYSKEWENNINGTLLFCTAHIKLSNDDLLHTHYYRSKIQNWSNSGLCVCLNTCMSEYYLGDGPIDTCLVNGWRHCSFLDVIMYGTDRTSHNQVCGHFYVISLDTVSLLLKGNAGVRLLDYIYIC